MHNKIKLPIKRHIEIQLLVIQSVLPIIPYLYVIAFKPELTTIKPCIIIPFLLCSYILMIICYWKRLGIMNSSRFDELAKSAVNAFYPWIAYNWVFQTAFERVEGDLWSQTLLYCIGQAIWIVATNMVPNWTIRNIIKKINNKESN